MMAPNPPPSTGEVRNSNQLVTEASNAGSGWRESIEDYTTTTAGNNERRERAADDEGSGKEGKGGKGDGE
jgi:hypothetical protein